MKNKKSVMMISALLILYYHLGVKISLSEAELFLKQISYVGVDMFFFISAYSLAGMAPCTSGGDYFRFVYARFKSVYVKFILFAIVAAVVSGWDILRFIKVIFFADLFTRGGGAFLWFLPAIMLFYILFPLFKSCDEKNRIVTAITIIAIFVTISALVTYNSSYKSMFIFWNRIPVFLIGYYSAKLCEYIKDLKESDTGFVKTVNSKWFMPFLGILLSVLGCILGVKYGYKFRLQVPFRDMFYIVTIPLALGLVIITGFIRENKIIKWIGSSTLEMYGIQMVFGYKIANALVKAIGINVSVFLKVCTNVCIILIVTILSVMLHYSYLWCENKLKSILRRN